MIELLALAAAGPDEFVGAGVAGAPGRVYGGHLAAQALAAADRTVAADRPVHSLHAYFLNAADPAREIRYRVTRLRDGGSYSLRQVAAAQGNRDVFTLIASFKVAEPSPERAVSIPAAPDPEGLPDAGPDLLSGVDRRSALRSVLDLRVVPRPPSHGGRTEQLLWVRVRPSIPPDPVLHREALTFCSDISLARTSALEHWQEETPRSGRRPVFLTSLDHAVWFHRHAAVDDWMLFAQRSSTAGDGRGLTTADFWTRDGVLVASVAQEVLQRPRALVVDRPRSRADQDGAADLEKTLR